MVEIISPKGNIGRNESIIGTLPSCITSPSLNIPIFLPLFTLRSKNRSSVLCEVFDKHMTEEDSCFKSELSWGHSSAFQCANETS